MLYTFKDENQTVAIVKFIEWHLLGRLVLSIAIFFIVLTVGIGAVSFLLETSLGMGRPDWLPLAYTYGHFLLILLTFYIFVSFTLKHEKIIIDKKGGALKGDKLSIPLQSIRAISLDAHWTKTRMTQGIAVTLSDGKKLTLLFYPEHVRGSQDETDQKLCDLLNEEILGKYKHLHLDKKPDVEEKTENPSEGM